MPKIGWVAYRDSRPIEETIKQATIKRVGNHWYVNIVCNIEKEIVVKPINQDKAIGLDLGLLHFATLSTGDIIDNPRFLKNELRLIKRLQRELSRKEKGSNNRKKCIVKLAKAYHRIHNKRRDFLHKLANKLVKNHDVIAVEDLCIKGMIQNRHLAQAISDVGWRMFLEFLEYKCTWSGKHFVSIDRFAPSSKTCSACKHKQDMPLHVRTFVCESCGIKIDRDLNASLNIRSAGLAVLNACGGSEVALPSEARITGF